MSREAKYRERVIFVTRRGHTDEPIMTKVGTFDYVGHTRDQDKFGQNRQNRGVWAMG